jgi:predicted nucleic acid-binding protein
MKKLRIYLDTSVISFLFADDAPEKWDITREFFEGYVAPRVHEVWISEVVIRELRRTRNAAHRSQLLAVVTGYGLARLLMEPEEQLVALAEAYVREGVIPRKKYDDALHVAISTMRGIDVLVSWNFEHLANVKKERRVSAVNEANGYFRLLRITTPLEVMSRE